MSRVNKISKLFFLSAKGKQKEMGSTYQTYVFAPQVRTELKLFKLLVCQLFWHGTSTCYLTKSCQLGSLEASLQRKPLQSRKHTKERHKKISQGSCPALRTAVQGSQSEHLKRQFAYQHDIKQFSTIYLLFHPSLIKKKPVISIKDKMEVRLFTSVKKLYYYTGKRETGKKTSLTLFQLE
jgi:hypothetical protein